MAGNFNEIQHVKKRRFLNEFARWGRIGKAAEIADVSRHSHYHWIQEDSEYAAAFEQARFMAGDMLEDEAVRRAVDGTEKPVYQRGEKVGTITEYSDPLLIFLLKGAKPDKYAERRDITSGGKALRITIANSDAI